MKHQRQSAMHMVLFFSLNMRIISFSFHALSTRNVRLTTQFIQQTHTFRNIIRCAKRCQPTYKYHENRNGSCQHLSMSESRKSRRFSQTTLHAFSIGTLCREFSPFLFQTKCLHDQFCMECCNILICFKSIPIKLAFKWESQCF